MSKHKLTRRERKREKQRLRDRPAVLKALLDLERTLANVSDEEENEPGKLYLFNDGCVGVPARERHDDFTKDGNLGSTESDPPRERRRTPREGPSGRAPQ